MYFCKIPCKISVLFPVLPLPAACLAHHTYFYRPLLKKLKGTFPEDFFWTSCNAEPPITHFRKQVIQHSQPPDSKLS